MSDATAAPPAPGQARVLAEVASDIKLAHSVFAMPFALLAAFAARDASDPWSRFLGQLGLVVVCMVAARTWAMLFNRLVDARFDAQNPRTRRRTFASGRVSMARGWAIASASAGVFVSAAAGFGAFFGNWWPALLSAPVLAWIAFYSLTKRFTWLCHVFLGGALAASPVAAAIAIDPDAAGLPALGEPGTSGVALPVVWWLAANVLLWVAGFDVIYALQDVDFDRGRGLKSIPASLGVPAAMWLSRAMHAGAVACLVAAWLSDVRLGPIFGVACGLVAALLVAEHLVLRSRGERGLDMAFFTINGVVSCVVGVAGILDISF